MKTKDGGHAFPVTHQHGMSMRQYYKSKFMAALIGSAEFGATLQRVFDPDREIANAGVVVIRPAGLPMHGHTLSLIPQVHAGNTRQRMKYEMSSLR